MRNLRASLTPVLLLAAGIFLLLRPGETLNLIVKVVGIIILLMGLFGVVVFVREKEIGNRNMPRLMVSVVEIVGGLLFLANPTYIVSLYNIFAGILILLSGISHFTLALDVKRAGFGNWKVMAVLTILVIVAGLVIILNPFEAATTVIRFIGLTLAYDGIVGFMILYYLKH